jgi:hypothetical protein
MYAGTRQAALSISRELAGGKTLVRPEASGARRKAQGARQARESKFAFSQKESPHPSVAKPGRHQDGAPATELR